MFGGKVTLSREDYGALTDLARKQITAESRESKLTTKIAKLKKENEEATERNAALEQKVRSLLPLKEALRKANNELGSLKAKYQKVLEFIEWLKLTEKPGEFLKVRASVLIGEKIYLSSKLSMLNYVKICAIICK